jgi:hypothetical protein
VGFFVVGGLSFLAALLPVVKGQAPNTAFLGVAVVFAILGALPRSKAGRSDGPRAS